MMSSVSGCVLDLATSDSFNPDIPSGNLFSVTAPKNRTFLVPEDADPGNEVPASRHWMLDAAAGWIVGLIRHDMGAAMSDRHEACCNKLRRPSVDPWNHDPEWYGGSDFCL